MKVTYKYNEGVNNNEKHSQNEQFIFFFFSSDSINNSHRKLQHRQIIKLFKKAKHIILQKHTVIIKSAEKTGLRGKRVSLSGKNRYSRLVGLQKNSTKS